MSKKNTYSKIEKLKSKKAIEQLFSKGKAINAFPLRLVYVTKSEITGIPINMGATVSKKNIKLAVNRNLLKRRLREAYRLNNSELKIQLLQANLELDLMLIYTSKQIVPYKEIEGKIKVLLTRLIEVCEVANS